MQNNEHNEHISQDSSEQMRQSSKPNDFSVTPRVVLIFSLCVGLIIILLNIDAVGKLFNSLFSILAPVLLGITLAYIINPLYKLFDRKFFKLFTAKGKRSEVKARKHSRALGIFLSVFLVLTLIVALIFLVIPQFIENLLIFMDRLPTIQNDITSWIDSQYDTGTVLDPFRENIFNFIRELVEGLNTDTSALKDYLSSITVTDLVSAASSVATVAFNVLFSIVICIYALIERDKFIAMGKKIVISLFSADKANDLITASRYGNDVFGKFITGKLLTSALVGLVTFLFMALAGIPYALLTSVIVGFCNIIPFIGPFIGGILTGFIVLVTDFRQGIIYIIFFLIVQQIDGNVISPMITEDRTGVSKFWVTFAVLLFGGMFGVGGMMFAVPVFAVLYYAIKIFVERRLAAKGLPVETTDYLNAGGVDPQTNTLAPMPESEPAKKPRLSLRAFVKGILGKKVTDLSENNENKTETEKDKKPKKKNKK